MKNKIHISPWMTIGTSFILMLIVTTLGVINYHRDKDRMGTLLNEKGAALIRSFEAGARTGMMGGIGSATNGVHLQRLLEETAGQPDISYISIIDRNGIIIAHNNKSLIGEIFAASDHLTALSPSDTPQWRIVGKKGKNRSFEVYKTYRPLPDSHSFMHGMMRRNTPTNEVLIHDGRIIFIGMSIQPFEAAMKEDLSHNLVMAAIIAALGIAGIISLFWSQSVARSRKQLQDTRKLASELVLHLPEGILVMDTQYRVIYSNRVAWQLLGFKEKTGRISGARQLLPDTIWALYDTIKSGKPRAQKEVRLLSEGGSAVPVAVSGADIHSEDGDYIGFMFLFKDLTEIRELEIKNQRVEKLATLGNLAAGIAHEIRNPLSSIKGYATFFGSLFDPGSENRKAAALMAEEVDRVNRVISELLEFARPSDLQMAPVRVADLVDHSLRIITHEARNAGVTISCSLEPELPEIEGDMDRLTQVCLNLYINALQAMTEEGQLRVSCRLRDDNIILEVCDTGKGIPEEQISRIFDPYFTTKGDGTGLGLAIAQKIIENHNGSITAESATGSGTRISIILPAATKERKI